MNNDYLENSNELINKIMQEVVSSIPEDGWETANLVAIYSDGVVDMTCHYSKDMEEIEFFVGSPLGSYLLELKELNTSEEKGTIKGVKFEIDATGKFEVHYSH